MTVQDNAAKITDLERTSYDNQRRVSAIEITVSECQTLALCEERNGRVMDAVDRLNETTAELQSTFRKFQEERAATDRASSRHTRATAFPPGSSGVTPPSETAEGTAALSV